MKIPYFINKQLFNYWQSNRCIGVSYMYWPKTHWFFYSSNFSAVIFAGVVVPPLISFLSWELTIVFGVDRKTRRRFDKFFSKHRILKDGSIGFVLFCTEVWINFHISIHMLISNQNIFFVNSGPCRMALSAIRCLGLEVEVCFYHSKKKIFGWLIFLHLNYSLDPWDKFVSKRTIERGLHKNQSTTYSSNTRW